MSTTITIRADDALRQALAERAAARGKTVSELVREILTAALEDRPLQARTGYLKGKLELSSQVSEPWRESLRQRNWRK